MTPPEPTHELTFGVNHTNYAEINKTIKEVIEKYANGEPLSVWDLEVKVDFHPGGRRDAVDMWHASVSCKVKRRSAA